LKYISYFLVFIFVVFAVLQFNDPDPWLWVPAYLFSAYTAYCSGRNYYNPMLLLMLCPVYFFWAWHLFPDSVSFWLRQEQKAGSLDMALPFIEEARESLGLFFCFVVNLIYLVIGLNKSRLPGYNTSIFKRTEND
jgi:hypothetical protein